MVQRHGITGPQALLLKQIVDRDPPGITVGELARQVNLGQATVTEILDRLEVRGFVRRTRSESDRRRVFINATPAGTRILQAAAPFLEDIFAQAFDRIPAADQAQTVAVLQRVAAMMDAQGDAVPILSLDNTQSPPLKSGDAAAAPVPKTGSGTSG